MADKNKKTTESAICYDSPQTDFRQPGVSTEAPQDGGHVKQPTASSKKRVLDVHVAEVHEKKTHFQCNVCGMLFALKCDLWSHETVHEDEKPFGCDTCKRYFTEKSTLKRHISSVHEGKKPYKCAKVESFNAESAKEKRQGMFVGNQRWHT